MRTNLALGDIEAFVAIAEQSSFRRAAETLNLSPPALSRRLMKLEQSLGVQLIERTTRSVGLTAVGREFLRRARSFMDDLEGSLLTLSEVATQRSALVTIACVPTATQYFLPPVIASFNERLPKARVRIMDLTANDVVAAVQSGEADFGISFIGEADPGLTFLPLLQDPFYLACRRDHPLAKRRQVRWAELDGHKFIAVWKGSGNRLLLDTRLADSGLQIKWFYEVKHLSASLGLVESGLGVSALPRSALPHEDHPIIKAIPLIDPVITRGVGTLRREGTTIPAAAQIFYDMLVDRWQSKRRPSAQSRSSRRKSG